MLFRFITAVHWWRKLSFWLPGECRNDELAQCFCNVHSTLSTHCKTAHSNVAYCGCSSSFPTFYSQPPRDNCKRLSWQIWVLLHALVTPGFAERSLLLCIVVCRVVLFLVPCMLSWEMRILVITFMICTLLGPLVATRLVWNCKAWKCFTLSLPKLWLNKKTLTSLQGGAFM